MMSGLTKRILFMANVSQMIKPAIIGVQSRNYAARKGYRAKRTKKAKVEEKKEEFIPHNLRNKEELLAKRPSKIFNDMWKGVPIDDCYSLKYYRWVNYTFEEAVLAHRETHHPEIYNQPNAYLHVTVELNMAAEKKNRFIDNFTRVCKIPHHFDHGDERTIIAFTKTPEMVSELMDAGATLAGGLELIKQIQNGDLNVQDFQYILAHPNILAELVVLRGLMKKRFPNVKMGNLDVDLVSAVDKYMYGINYSGKKDEREKEFGVIETKIGTLNMDLKKLEENYVAFVNDVNEHKTRSTGDFIRRTILWSPPSKEKLKVDHSAYLKKREIPADEDDDDDEVTVEIAENEKAVAT